MTDRSTRIDPSRRPPACAAAPILHSLLPLVCGILMARHGCLVLMIPVLPLWGLASRWLSVAPGIPVLSLLAGALLMQQANRGPDPSWQILPPREIALRLRVEETFNARKPGHLSGVGTILGSDLLRDTISGRSCAFYLEYRPGVPTDCGAGDILNCQAVLTYLPAEPEPGAYYLYLKSRYIYLNLSRGFVEDLASPASGALRQRRYLQEAGKNLLRSGSQGTDSPGNVLASMMLGDRSLLTDERVELYRRTGSYHLFAVSGLHVGSVALCLNLIAVLLRVPGKLRFIPLLAGTWAYVWLAGASPSAMRAGIMVSCFCLARLVFRQPHLLPALALSAWLVLLRDPLQLFNLGFQLSYAVVGSIILVGLPLSSHAHGILARLPAFAKVPLPRKRRWLLKAVRSAASLGGVSLSASLASMPLIIQHFSLFTPGALILGPLLNPLATFTVMTGSTSLLLAPILGTDLAGWVARISWPAIQLMELLLEACLKVPGTVSGREWTWPQGGTLMIVLMLATAWALQWFRQQGRPLHPLTLLVPILMVSLGLGFGTVGT